MATSAPNTVAEELALMRDCLDEQAHAYSGFLMAAQMGRYDVAGIKQLESSAALESAMDAFLRACRMRGAL